MKVIKNTPAPVTPPPTTYDIVGLTLTELRLIHLGVGRGTADDSINTGGELNTGFNLYRALGEALAFAGK